MKNVAGIVVAALFLCSLPGLAQPSRVPAGLTQIPPVSCAGNQSMLVENRYIETSGNGIEVSGNCTLEVKNSHIVADGYAVLVEFNGTVEISGSTIEGGKAAFRAAGNGDIYYEHSHVRGRMETSWSGEIEDGGNNTREGASERVTAALDESVAVDTGDALLVVGPNDIQIHSGGVVIQGSGDDWRVRSDADSFDTSLVLVELGAVADGDRLRLHLAGDVLFDFDSDVIRPSAALELAKVAHVLRHRSVGEIVLEGHTDSVGSLQYNQTLSQARAAAVRLWLHEKEGIPLRLLVARGWGEEKPAAYNTMPDGSDNPAGRAKNRRVEISFTSSQPAGQPQSAAVSVRREGVSVQSGPTQVRVTGVERQSDNSQPTGACAEVCNRWPELNETEVSCVTSALLLGGYDVYDYNACLAVDSTSGCRLCWRKLHVTEQDCAKLSRLCIRR